MLLGPFHFLLWNDLIMLILNATTHTRKHKTSSYYYFDSDVCNLDHNHKLSLNVSVTSFNPQLPLLFHVHIHMIHTEVLGVRCMSHLDSALFAVSTFWFAVSLLGFLQYSGFRGLGWCNFWNTLTIDRFRPYQKRWLWIVNRHSSHIANQSSVC